MAVTARAGAPSVGALLGGRGTVAAVRADGVAMEFAADGRAVAPHGAGDLGLVTALPSERGQHISLPGGELVVRHGEYPLRGSRESSPVSPLTSVRWKRVALSI